MGVGCCRAVECAVRRARSPWARLPCARLPWGPTLIAVGHMLIVPRSGPKTRRCIDSLVHSNMVMHFFDGASPAVEVSAGSATFSLPIRYYRDDTFLLAFSADLDGVRAQMPSNRLHPVVVGRDRALIIIGAFNYIDTSIGPYGEVAVVAPAVYGKRPLPLLPALREGAYPGFGLLVLHLPVTSRVARDAGRGQWGYTKFVADMEFEHTPEHLSCALSEGEQHILTLRVARGGWFGRDRRPLCTYSVKDGDLIKTTIPQQGSFRWRPRCRDSSLSLGDHPVARFLRDLDLSPEPVLKRYFIERAAILPAGEVIERGVRPLDGHAGVDIAEARHTVRYD